MDQKNCIIVHGCPSSKENALNPETRTYDKHWLPWLTRELNARGIKTEMPLMPDPWEPQYKKFKKEFEKYEVNENTILVGHSCGTAFLLDWLGESKQKIAKLVLVSPWKITDKDDEFRRKFYERPIDPTVKSRVGKIIMFTSNNDYENGKKSVGLVRDVLGGEVIAVPDHGHFTLKDMGTEAFPELLEAILN